MYKLMFYLVIVNKILRQCRSRLARQYILLKFLYMYMYSFDPQYEKETSQVYAENK